MRHQYTDADKAALERAREKRLAKRERLIDGTVARMLAPEPLRRREALAFVSRALAGADKKDELAALIDDLRSTELDVDARQALQAQLRELVATDTLQADLERSERYAAEHPPALYAGIRATLLYQRGHTDTPPWDAAAQEG